jgi:hypothetical protein
MSRTPSKARKPPSRLTHALLETAKDMRDGGILTEPAYETITLRHVGKGETSPLFDAAQPVEPARSAG